jgi:hypothetical protein
MSRFDLSVARQIAEKAVRRRDDGSEADAKETAPLHNREAALLVALQEAERAHDEALQAANDEQARLDEFEPMRERHRHLRKHVNAALEEWQDMGHEGQLGIAWHAHATGSVGSDLNILVKRLQAGLHELRRASESASRVEFQRGRKFRIGQKNEEKTRLEPLFAIAAVLKAFWMRETNSEFGHELYIPDDRSEKRKPKSPATRLVW